MPKLPAFPVEGGCICGAVRYRLKGAPLGVYNCHCKDCQRQSGAAYSASMIVSRENFELIAGDTLVFDKPADSGRTVRQHACLVCHTRLYNEPLSSPDFIVLKPGTLDDSTWAVPIGNIWTESRAPWSQIDGEQPSFPGQPSVRDALFTAWRRHFSLGG